MKILADFVGGCIMYFVEVKPTVKKSAVTMGKYFYRIAITLTLNCFQT